MSQKKNKPRGPRKLSPSERVRLESALRLMAGRCRAYRHSYDLPKRVAEHIGEAHDHLCEAFSTLEAL